VPSSPPTDTRDATPSHTDGQPATALTDSAPTAPARHP
jgi:hypothetical protein